MLTLGLALTLVASCSRGPAQRGHGLGGIAIALHPGGRCFFPPPSAGGVGVIHFGGWRLSCEALPRGESRFRRVVPAPMGGDNGFLLGPISAYWLQTQTHVFGSETLGLVDPFNCLPRIARCKRSHRIASEQAI